MIPLLGTGELWTNPILVGLLVGIPTSVFGWLAYRRAEALDEAAAEAAALAARGDAVQRVIDGLDLIIRNLRVDNKDERDKVAALRVRLAECNTAYGELKKLKTP